MRVGVIVAGVVLVVALLVGIVVGSRSPAEWRVGSVLLARPEGTRLGGNVQAVGVLLPSIAAEGDALDTAPETHVQGVKSDVSPNLEDLTVSIVSTGRDRGAVQAVHDKLLAALMDRVNSEGFVRLSVLTQGEIKRLRPSELVLPLLGLACVGLAGGVFVLTVTRPRGRVVRGLRDLRDPVFGPIRVAQVGSFDYDGLGTLGGGAAALLDLVVQDLGLEGSGGVVAIGPAGTGAGEMAEEFALAVGHLLRYELLRAEIQQERVELHDLRQGGGHSGVRSMVAVSLSDVRRALTARSQGASRPVLVVCQPLDEWEGKVVAGSSDSIVLLVRSGIREDTIRDLCAELGALGSPVAGVLLWQSAAGAPWEPGEPKVRGVSRSARRLVSDPAGPGSGK